jgi:hypothetical protein
LLLLNNLKKEEKKEKLSKKENITKESRKIEKQ